MRCFGQGPARGCPYVACLLTAIVALILTGPGYVRAQGKPADSSGSTQVAKAAGTIKSIQADSITVSAESGGEMTARGIGSTKILLVLQGERDLKNATTLHAQDLQTVVRVLVTG